MPRVGRPKTDENKMSIQFVCLSCRQPVEIDDQHAGQQVVCPYCEAVITAPHASNLEPAQRPTARPFPPTEVSSAPAFNANPAMGYTGGYGPPPLMPNRLGNIALVLALLAWGLALAQAIIWFSAMTPIFEKAASTSQPNQAEVQKEVEAFVKQFMSDKKYASQRSTLAVLSGLTLLSGLATLILGIIALNKRNARKGTAIAGLLLLVPLVLCQFFGMAMNLMSGVGGG